MQTSSMEFFDLAGDDPEIRFSPYCWKTRMALAHKGIAPTTIPWRYSDKPKIAFTDQGSVPVIRHGKVGVSDSWKIALYLEEAFPDRPSLFGGGASIPLCHFVNSWADAVLMPAVARIVMKDVHALLMVADRPYFRSTREQRFGMTLEELVADRPAKVQAFRKDLVAVKHLLAKQPFLGGTAPMYADYCVFGAFMWARCCSDAELLEPGDRVVEWHEAMLDLFDGLGRNAPRAGTGRRAAEENSAS